MNSGDHTTYTTTWRRVNTLIEVLVLVRILILEEAKMLTISMAAFRDNKQALYGKG